MKKWIGMSVAIVVIVILSACGGQEETKKAEAGSDNQTDVKKASAYPEADQVARNSFEALVDLDFRAIYEEHASKKLQDYVMEAPASNSPIKSDSSYQDGNFSGLDKVSIKKEEALNPGGYKELVNDKDYFFAMYDQLKDKGVLNYILIGKATAGLYSLPGESGTPLAEIYPDNNKFYVFKLEMEKEEGKWKLSSYQSWPHFDEFDASDREARIQKMVRADSKNITVLHRGKSFVSDSN
ncbi:hypothetical protein [Listeria goaensis]|uniref:hypothetical protein n=1 Tax=Listeria goaensis TaxID=1649188 RepID=UPI000B58CACD|nr:hypothetical protein [Listeria goaensis]